MFNTHWIITFGRSGPTAIGYFLWLLSFHLLAIGLFISSRLVLSVGKQFDETRIRQSI
jgi:hypothetical protein